MADRHVLNGLHRGFAQVRFPSRIRTCAHGSGGGCPTLSKYHADLRRPLAVLCRVVIRFRICFRIMFDQVGIGLRISVGWHLARPRTSRLGRRERQRPRTEAARELEAVGRAIRCDREAGSICAFRPEVPSGSGDRLRRRDTAGPCAKRSDCCRGAGAGTRRFGPVVVGVIRSVQPRLGRCDADCGPAPGSDYRAGRRAGRHADRSRPC